MSEIHYYERPILPVRYPQRHRRALAGGGGSTISSTARLLSQPSLEFLNLAPGLYEIPSMFKKWDSHGCRRGARRRPGTRVFADASRGARNASSSLRRTIRVETPRRRFRSDAPAASSSSSPRGLGDVREAPPRPGLGDIREAPRGGAER